MIVFTSVGLTLSGFIFLLLITIGYIKSQKNESFTSVIFRLLLISALIASICDVAFGFLINNHNVVVLQVLEIVYVFMTMTWINSLAVYLISVANKDAYNNRKYIRVWSIVALTILTIIPFALKLVLNLIPPFENDNPATSMITALGRPTYFCGIIILGVIIYLFITAYKRMDKMVKIPFISTLIMLIIEILFSVFKIEFNELTFLFEILTVTVYLTSESGNIKMIKDIVVSKAESEVTLGGQNEFISSMSHDIRTPLGAITGYTDILYHDKELTLEKAKEELASISEASEKLNDLMSNLMDLSILNEGSETIVKDTYNVQKIASSIEEKLSAKIQRKGNTYSYLISERLPLNLDCDGEKISRIFELLINIINSNTENGSITVNYSGEINEEKYVIKGTIEAYNNNLTREAFDITFNKYMEMYANKINTIDSENLGLIIAKNYIELLKGTYEYFLDETGKTICNVSIPVEFSQGDAE